MMALVALWVGLSVGFLAGWACAAALRLSTPQRDRSEVRGEDWP